LKGLESFQNNENYQNLEKRNHFLPHPVGWLSWKTMKRRKVHKGKPATWCSFQLEVTANSESKSGWWLGRDFSRYTVSRQKINLRVCPGEAVAKDWVGTLHHLKLRKTRAAQLKPTLTWSQSFKVGVDKIQPIGLTLLINLQQKKTSQWSPLHKRPTRLILIVHSS
jgi:hypothetical protein